MLGIDHGEDGLVNREISEIIENYKQQTTAKINTKSKSGALNIEINNEESAAQNLQPVAIQSKNTAFMVDDAVVVKNKETGETYRATIVSVNKNDQGQELYTVRYFDDEEEGNVDVQRITSYNQTMINAPQSPLYSPQSPLYSPQSPSESPAEDLVNSLTNRVQTSVDNLDNTLGEIGSSVSNTFSSAADAVTNRIGSISDAISGGNQLEIFDDPQMNDVFNKLSPDKKATIIKMDEEQRKSVMSQIMAATQQAQQTSSQSGGGLSSYFNGLPVQNQIAALQNTYKSMANEFKQLSGAVNAPQITILKPQSAAEALYGSTLSLFAPDSGVKKGGSTNDSSNDSSATSNTSESSTSSINQSGGYVVKKI